MTDYQAEYAAFRADVLSRVIRMPSVHRDFQQEIAHWTKLGSAKKIAETWLEWDRERNAAFVQGLKEKFPTLCKSDG